MVSSLKNETMYQAFKNKDSKFEGIFFVGVKTTGIFCRPTCTARKPHKKNVTFFSSIREALLEGYRPCKICSPLDDRGDFPKWLNPLIDEISQNPDATLKDYELKKRDIDPNRVRRWFKKNYGMTFQAYLRSSRISKAFERIKYGDKVIEAAFESGYESLSGFTDSFKKKTGFSPNQSKGKEIIQVTRILTPLGPMLAGAIDQGICFLEFFDRRMLDTQLKKVKKLLVAEILPGSSKYFEQLDKELKQYFEGDRKEFTIPLILAGTFFQKKVWDLLQKIPFGQTRCYEEQAKALGNPDGIRAVAKANGDNHIAILVPCHRVIGKNGELRGYGGGLWRKKYLLDLEKPN